MPFMDDEEPTKPEGFAAELRLMAERVLATEHSDVAVLRMLRDAAVNGGSDADTLRYMRACLEWVERLLG